MILLDATTRSLELDLNAAVATTQLPYVVSYVDISQSTFAVSAMASSTGVSNSTTAVTMLAAPGATTSRQLKYLSVKNSDTASVLLWVQMNDNATLRELWKGTLAVGDSLIYTDGSGFYVLDTTGRMKSGGGVTGPGLSVDNALVRWDGTGGTSIQSSGWTLSDTDVLNGVSGTVAAPSHILNSETGSGLYRIGANNHGYTISGAKVLDISATGLGVTGTLSATSTFNVTGTGPHAVGGATDSKAQWRQTGAFSSGATDVRGYWIDSSLTSPVNGGAYGLILQPTLIEAASGTHGTFAGLYVEPTITNGVATTTDAAGIYVATFAAGAGTTNASGIKINAAPTGATNNYALWAAGGSVRIDGTGPHSVGGTTAAFIQWLQQGTFTPSDATAYAMVVQPTIVPSPNRSAHGIMSGITINKAASGTHADFTGAWFNAPVIGAGASTLTNASTVKIEGAPTGATNNYALWSAGNTRWDSGYLKASSNTTYTGLTALYHELYNANDTGVQIAVFKNAAATATNQYGVALSLTGDPNNTTNWFVQCVGNATERATIRSNGGLANFSANNVNLSDATVKRDKGATADYTALVKALKFRKFTYLDDQTENEIDGLMAQDVMALDPSLVTEFSAGKMGIYTHRLQERINSVIPQLIARIEALEAA